MHWFVLTMNKLPRILTRKCVYKFIYATLMQKDDAV